MAQKKTRTVVPRTSVQKAARILRSMSLGEACAVTAAEFEELQVETSKLYNFLSNQGKLLKETDNVEA